MLLNAENTISTTSFNSRAAATLAASATFQGVGENVTKYGRAGIAIVSDNATDGVLTIEVSHDNTNWGGPTRTWADTRFGQPHMWNIVEPYFRIKYVNGTTEATNLKITVQYSVSADVVLGHQLDATLIDEIEAQVVRSVGVAQDPTGAYKNSLNDGLGFTTSALLANGATYDSAVLSLVGYTQVQTHVLSDVNGTIVIDFVSDSGGTDIIRSLTIPYVSTDGFQMFSAPAFSSYVRYRFTADEAGQADFYFDSKFTTKPISGQLLGLTGFISPTMVAPITRSIAVGQTDGGNYVNVPVTPEGHLEVALHDPILPFGAVHTESLTPIFQTDAVYGINLEETVVTTGLGFDAGPAIGSNTGSVTSADSMFTCSTGTTAYSFGSLQSKKRLRYRAGQGLVGRFTALYSTPQASSVSVAGFGSGEDGYYFGYNGTSFGILHSKDAIREIQTFTVSAATSTGGTVTFRLNGLDTQVTLATSATTTLTANDIASQSFPGWTVEARGATVIFLANAVGDKAGTFSITLGTAVGTNGTFAETRAGVAATDTWIAQSAWNGDVCDGTGLTGFTLDQTKGNVFQIGVAWLGFGAVNFKIQIPGAGGNNANWVTVHTINNPNALTAPHVKQPSFPFTAAAYSSGSTTDISVSVGSFAGFVEGDLRYTGPRSSFSGTSQTVTTGSYHTLLSIRNDYIFGHAGVTERANQAVVNILSFGGAHDDATPITYYLLKNATLVGPASWGEWSANSCIYYDTGATTATIADNGQIVQALPIGQGGTFTLSLEDTTTLQPGETLTIAAKATTGTSTWTIGTLNVREDQ